ncbi:MAG: malonate decarboxylase subunit alpha [Candidatus Binatia bacterium]
MTRPKGLHPRSTNPLASVEEWVDKARILAQLARGGLSWVWHDTRYPSPVAENPKFMSPRDAVKLVHDGDVVAAPGLGGNQRASIIYWAIREAFEETGHPAGLTVMNLGGHGGRGKAPGTLEELGQAGLCTRVITSHFETLKAMLDLAAAGQCELECLPLGIMALLFDALGRGQTSLVTSTGVDTCVDPRVGCGSRVAKSASQQLISVHGDQLRYRIPKIDVAVFNLPAADRRGNLYVKHSAMIGDSYELARAAKRNRGRVIANVGLIVDEGYDRVFLPADMVDAVVYHPDTEQTAGVFHRDFWPVLTTDSDVSIAEGLARVQFVNWLAGVTSQRSAADAAVARLAATTLLANVRKGAYVNIGVGLPEEVCRVVFEAGRLGDVTFLNESGVLGGLPAPGIYFGAALCPQEIVSSAAIFKLCYERLDAACLGVLQADSEGNVNVSKRGDGARNYVGPGGFIDLTTAAKTIVFVSAWMAHAHMTLEDGMLRLVKRGTPKFVDRVDEVTFSGPRAVAAGKRVFYATHVGLFQLTSRGMELVRIMPGIDVRRDILDRAAMKVVLPASGRVPVVAESIVSGEGFTLRPAGRRSDGSART